MVRKINFYVPKWSWPPGIEAWLKRESQKRFTLNFPCGLSKVGDIRADVDPSVKPDIICDLLFPPFKDKSFDFVIVDPPFSMYNKFRWIHRLGDLTKDRIIFCGLPNRLSLKGFKVSYRLSADYIGFFLRIWHIFKRKDMNFTLDSYEIKRKYKKNTYPSSPRYRN